MSAKHPSDDQASSGIGMSNFIPDKVKPMRLDDPYKHAPKQAGDPWAILLRPEFETDRIRCEAWKDEVQTLLIFAGLFSSVTTAFVINSYQVLQPNPNDAVIGLLFHIANSLNNSSPFPPSVNPTAILTPFSQTSSFVRINIFWFLSLILSLTTVLIGTTALQWLREHQAYPGCSAKETLAILRMRSEALEAWHVPQIFSALPLILQAALVLFMAGLIDFSFLLGPNLTIVISVVVGITLLFFATTTALPTIQGLSFFFRFTPHRKVPTPCPFKSPQSDAFRTLYGIVLRVIFFIFPRFTSHEDEDRDNMNPLPLAQRHMAPYIFTLWNQKIGPSFDREWLFLRDVCHQRILDKDPFLYEHQQEWKDQFPLSDITQCVLKAAKEAPGTKYTEEYLTAACHCFQELSSSIWSTRAAYSVSNQRTDRRNNYFEQLQKHEEDICSVSKFLIHGGTYNFNRSPSKIYMDLHSSLFYRDHIYLFLNMLQTKHGFPTLMAYQLELLSRMTHYLFENHITPLTVTYVPQADATSSGPSLFDMGIIHYITSGNYPTQGFSVAADILNLIFESAASHDIPRDQLMNSICTHQMSLVLPRLASLTDDYLRQVKSSANLHSVGEQYKTTFKFVADYLIAEMSSPSLDIDKGKTPCLLFYVSSIFAWHLLNFPGPDSLMYQEGSFSQGLRALLDSIRRYRDWSSDRKDNTIELRFQDQDNAWDLPTRLLIPIERFSRKWWDKLDSDPNNIINLPSNELHPSTPNLDVTIQPLVVDFSRGDSVINIRPRV